MSEGLTIADLNDTEAGSMWQEAGRIVQALASRLMEVAPAEIRLERERDGAVRRALIAESTVRDLRAELEEVLVVLDGQRIAPVRRQAILRLLSRTANMPREEAVKS